MGNKTFDKIHGVLKMIVSIFSSISILIFIIGVLTGNDERINLSLNDIPSLIGEIIGLIIAISLSLIFSVYLFISGKLQFRSQKSRYRVLYFLSIPISFVILFYCIIMIIGIFRNPNYLTEIEYHVFFFILMLIIYVIIEDSFYQFSRNKYEFPTNNQVIVNTVLNPNPIALIIEEQKNVNNNQICPEVNKNNNSKYSKLEKLFMIRFRFKNLNRGFLILIIVGAILIPISISLFSDWMSYPNKWVALLLYAVSAILLYCLIVFAGLWIYNRGYKNHIIRFKNLNKGFSRLIIVGSLLIPIAISLLSDWKLYTNMWFALLLYFVSTILLYWLIVFVGLWIYDGFIIEKNIKK